MLKKILDFIYKIWNNEDGNDGVFNYFSEEFEEIAEKAYKNLTANIKNNDKIPFLIRIAGQSGSGKTTQLMPTIKSNLDEEKQQYVLLAVRLFAEYHPNYSKLLEKYGSGLIREKTNGFALLLLLRVLEKLIENKYNILFEVTLLEPIFEEYIVKISKKNNYKLYFNILSINRELSDAWILKRQNNNGNENNRIVYKSSSSYFYEVLPKALEKIIEMKNYFDENDRIIIWSAFDEQPCLNTNIFGKNVLEIFKKYRKIVTYKNISEEKLRGCKLEFYKNLVKIL